MLFGKKSLFFFHIFSSLFILFYFIIFKLYLLIWRPPPTLPQSPPLNQKKKMGWSWYCVKTMTNATVKHIKKNLCLVSALVWVLLTPQGPETERLLHSCIHTKSCYLFCVYIELWIILATYFLWIWNKTIQKH